MRRWKRKPTTATSLSVDADSPSFCTVRRALQKRAQEKLLQILSNQEDSETSFCRSMFYLLLGSCETKTAATGSSRDDVPAATLCPFPLAFAIYPTFQGKPLTLEHPSLLAFGLSAFALGPFVGSVPVEAHHATGYA